MLAFHPVPSSCRRAVGRLCRRSHGEEGLADRLDRLDTLHGLSSGDHLFREAGRILGLYHV